MADAGIAAALAGARAVLVGFDGYLRPSETLAARKSDIAISRKSAVLRYPRVTPTLAPQRNAPDDGSAPLRRAKAGHRDDASRAAGRGLTIGTVKHAVASARSGQRRACATSTPTTSRPASALPCAIHRSTPTPHSFRYGGPSADAPRQTRTVHSRGHPQARALAVRCVGAQV